MQLTATEHAASPYAAQSCSECHLPRVRDGWFGAHRSHAFAEARDPARLRAALSVHAETNGCVSRRSRSRRSTWDMPTRRATSFAAWSSRWTPSVPIIRSLQASVATSRAISSNVPSALARHGERVSRRDNRVMPGAPSRVELDLGSAGTGLPVSWRVRYERVLHLNPRHEADARVESSLVLASGVVSETPSIQPRCSRLSLLRARARAHRQQLPVQQSAATLLKPRRSRKSAPSASVLPSATASAAPAVQRVESPSGKLPASVSLLDLPFEHFGEQSRPPPYYVHRVRGATLVTRGGDVFKLDGDKAVEQPAPQDSAATVCRLDGRSARY